MIDLEQLEEDLRAERVEMDPPRRAALGSRLQDARRSRPERSWAWLLRPAAALAVIAVAAVGITTLDGGPDAPPRPEAMAGATTADDATEPAAPGPPVLAAPSTDSATAAPSPPAQGQGGLSGRRAVERTTSLSLATGAENLQDVANGVVRETKQAGGVVDASTVSRTEDGGTASFSLRIPSARLPAAVAALSELGDVVGLDEATQDITGTVSSAAERLSEARAERRGILRSLQRADSDTELRALRQRLREVRSRISRAQGDLTAARRRAEVASVQVEVRASGAGRADDEGGVWSPRDAAGDAWRVLQVTAGVLLVAAAALVPAGLVGLAVVTGLRGARRRRREHALDPM